MEFIEIDAECVMTRITVAIQDDVMEKRLQYLMQAQDKPASEIILDALRNFLGGSESPVTEETLAVLKLSIAQHSRIITLHDDKDDELPDDATIRPFSFVKNTVGYAKKLRKESWQ